MRLVMALALGSLACKDFRPPRMERVCTESHSDFMYFMLVGDTQVPMYQSVCDRYEMQCVVGKDYTGPLSCEVCK